MKREENLVLSHVGKITLNPSSCRGKFFNAIASSRSAHVMSSEGQLLLSISHISRMLPFLGDKDIST